MGLLICALLLGGAVLKQEIVVTAERAPAQRSELTTAASIIAKPQIDAVPSSNANDLLRLIPGMAVFGSTIAVRGFYGGGEVEYVQLRIDGVPAGDVESGIAAWQQFRAEELERVEVVRGMESPLYGDTALGGVVQLFTRHRASRDWNATLGAGSHHSGDLAASAFLGNFSLFVDGRTTNGDRPHSDATRKGARLTWSRALDDTHLLTVAADHRASDVKDGGLLGVEALFANDFENSTRRNAAATFEANAWSASVHASAKRAEGVRTILLFPPAIADSAQRTLHSGEFGGAMQFDRGTIRGGADVARQRFDVAYRTTSADVHRDVFAAYATQHLPLGEKLTLVTGIRGDSIGGDRAFSPRLAFHANVAGAAIYLGAASGFKTASLEQLYDVRPLHAFGQTFTLANAALVPQRARSLEAGISRRGRFGLWQLDAYRIRVAHEIDFDPRTFRYGNISRSEHRGIEAAFEPNAGMRIEPRLTYTWMRVFSLDDPTRSQLKNIPEHSATAMLTAHLPLNISATALYTWNGNRWFDDAESIAAPDTNDLSFRIAWRALRLDVLNATGAHDATYGFVLADFRGQPHSYSYPGARRAVRISIDLTSRRSPRE